MSRNPKYFSVLESEKKYHIYNRCNDKEFLFRDDEDRYFFLDTFDAYLSPFLDVYCRNLLLNHFHFLVRMKSEEQCRDNLKFQRIKLPFEKKYVEGKISFEKLLELEFKRFFITYSIYYNAKYLRKGNLFNRPFKRLEIGTDSHFTEAVIYIHANALKHNLVKDFTLYPWSSWGELIGDQPTKLLRLELFEWFGGVENLIKAHHNFTEHYYSTETAIELE